MRRTLALLTLVCACSAKAPPPAKISAPVGSDTSAGADNAGEPPPPPPPPPLDARPPKAPPDARQCPPQNPKGCPVAEPNVNRPCDVKGAECVYDAECCHQITYVCAKNLHFEARIQRCQ